MLAVGIARIQLDSPALYPGNNHKVKLRLYQKGGIQENPSLGVVLNEFLPAKFVSTLKQWRNQHKNPRKPCTS